MKKYLFGMVLFVAGVVVGVLIMIFGQYRQASAMAEFEAFGYGVISSTLQGTGVEWKEYPQFRTVEFQLHGELVVQLPRGAKLVPEGLVDETALQEISREKKQVTNGEASLEYDVVTYLFQQAKIKANTSNIYGVEKDAVAGYTLSCVTDTEQIVVGYIVPMCKEFHVCTKEQTEHWGYPQNLEFELLKLSRTYLEKDVTKPVTKCAGIVVERVEGTYDLCIRNDGNEAWNYSRMVPSVEVWNQGVWMELETLLDNPLVGSTLEPGETEELKVPGLAIESMPYLAPGIYRMVVYGENNSYAATEAFVIP